MTHRWATLISAAALALSATAAAQQAQPDPSAGASVPPPAGERAEATSDRNLYPHLAAALIAEGATVIDVRSAQEVEATGKVDGATQIPHTELDAIAAHIGEKHNGAVVVYCRNGRRSGLVVEQLAERGFSGLVNAGGYAELTDAIAGRRTTAE
jgi:phage shock protein E